MVRPVRGPGGCRAGTGRERERTSLLLLLHSRPQGRQRQQLAALALLLRGLERTGVRQPAVQPNVQRRGAAGVRFRVVPNPDGAQRHGRVQGELQTVVGASMQGVGERGQPRTPAPACRADGADGRVFGLHGGVKGQASRHSAVLLSGSGGARRGAQVVDGVRDGGHLARRHTQPPPSRVVQRHVVQADVVQIRDGRLNDQQDRLGSGPERGLADQPHWPLEESHASVDAQRRLGCGLGQGAGGSAVCGVDHHGGSSAGRLVGRHWQGQADCLGERQTHVARRRPHRQPPAPHRGTRVG
mmetsp:Transcript_6546/g.26944  ORF Transcript_6546/g.26944 Transcript_6546/m.26944 type:complete len:299 (-) Transcript_6546:864-1760(-)